MRKQELQLRQDAGQRGFYPWGVDSNGEFFSIVRAPRVRNDSLRQEAHDWPESPFSRQCNLTRCQPCPCPITQQIQATSRQCNANATDLNECPTNRSLALCAIAWKHRDGLHQYRYQISPPPSYPTITSGGEARYRAWYRYWAEKRWWTKSYCRVPSGQHADIPIFCHFSMRFG